MSAFFQLIHFTPDPFTGQRFPLGAIVAEAGGKVRVAKVERLPSAACPGDRSLAVTVRRLHARLDAIQSTEKLPAVFGPYATLSGPQAIPSGVQDALSWVQELLEPKSPAAPKPATPRGAQRSTYGYRFFETFQVTCFVRKTFRPASDWGGWFRRHAAGLQQVTHWVAGEQTILLMEPIVPARRQFDQDLREIATRFGAYRYALESADNGRECRLAAYVTAGGHPDQRAAARETLGPFAHLVVDTTDDRARDRFLSDIRRVGSEADAQQELAVDA
jgi:hypothetical protein